MRIEAYTQVQQIYKTSKTDKSQRKPGVGATDQLQISSIGREYQVAKQAVAASSDIREEITAPLKIVFRQVLIEWKQEPLLTNYYKK